jgi:type I restriction enzyme S subunit
MTQSGGTPSTTKKEYWEGGDVPWINSGALKDLIISEPSKYITKLGLDNSSARIFPPKTVVIALTGATTGKVGILDFPTSTNQSVTGIFPSDAFVSEYLFYFLRSARDNVVKQAIGSAQPHINKRIVDDLKVPLAPLVEQRRIVIKLEKLLAKVDACQTRLAKIPTLLKRFRQSILAAACSGRLTADWRDQNQNLEPGVLLLDRIRETRQKTAENSKDRNQIAEAFQEERLKFANEEFDLNSIPDSWEACRIGAIAKVVNGSTPSRKRNDFWDGDIPWVSSGEVRNNIIFNTREKVTKEGFKSCSVRLLPLGTVLLAMIGEGKTRGQSAILQIQAAINQNIAAVLIPHGLVNPGFLWRWFHFQYEATPQALNCQRVRELPFVLPPLAEQHEIVRRVESLFGLANQIEARYAKAQAHVDKLTPSLLAKAFRGELVPQDEPASALLSRIQAARSGQKVSLA